MFDFIFKKIASPIVKKIVTKIKNRNKPKEGDLVKSTITEKDLEMIEDALKEVAARLNNLADYMSLKKPKEDNLENHEFDASKYVKVPSKMIKKKKK